MKKTKNRKNKFVSAMLFSIIALVAFLPVSTFVAGFFAVGSLAMSFITLPAGILGTGAGGAGTEEAIIEKVNTLLEKMKSEFKNPDYSEKFKAIEDLIELNKKSDEKLKQVEKDLLETASKLKAMEEKGTREHPMSKEGFKSAIFEGLKEKAEDILNIQKVKNGLVRLNLKTAGVISSSNFGAGVLQGFRLPGVEAFERNPQNLLQYISIYNGGEGSDPFSWVEKTNADGGAGWVTEGNPKPYYDYDFVEGTATAQTIAAISLVSTRAILKMPMLNSIINEELLAELREKFQTAVLVGSGTPPAIYGIKSKATAFSAGAMANSVLNANYWDCLLAVAQQVMLAKGRANCIVVHPSMWFKLLSTKTTVGEYQMPDYASIIGENIMVAGIPVIPSFDLTTADDIIGGDFRKYMLNIVQDVTVDIGWINDNFAKNQFAVRAEMMAAGGVKAQHTNKLVSTTFATVKAAILDPNT